LVKSCLCLPLADRSRTFWANSLKQAYYDQSKVTPAAVDAYRMPQLVRGWETGMVQFLLARLGAGGSRSATTAAAAVAPGSQPPGGLEDVGLAMRFAAAVAAANLPVLIVHGAGDKLVPVSNSFNLARLIKNCRLAVVKKAGHCPQEEQPELFTDLVCGFLKKHIKSKHDR
jgi:pimeloyl-ACP methyl ester carboxylesterase